MLYLTYTNRRKQQQEPIGSVVLVSYHIISITEAMNAGIIAKIKPTSNVKDENSGSSNVPSGFILKLYQMVNGAPNEVITVRLFSLKEQIRETFFKIGMFLENDGSLRRSQQG